MSSQMPSGYLAMNICTAIGATVLFYDALLTLDVEVEYVWRQRWSVSKVLYLICRYFFTVLLFMTLTLTLIANPPQMMCRVWQDMSLLIMPSVATVIPDAIILLRLDALCRADPKIRYFTFFVYLSLLIVLTITSVLNLVTGTRFVIPRASTPNFNIGCDLHINNTNKVLNIFAWVIPTAAQVYYFLLVISRFLVCAKEIGRDTDRWFGHILKMRKIVPTLYRLLRDGTIYFVVTLIQYVLIFTLSNSLPTTQLWLPLVTLVKALNPLLASRLYLGLRARGPTENYDNVIGPDEELTFARSEDVEPSQRRDRG